MAFGFRLLFPGDKIGKNMQFHSEVIKFNDNRSVYDLFMKGLIFSKT